MKRPVKPKRKKITRDISSVGELRELLTDQSVPDEAVLSYDFSVIFRPFEEEFEKQLEAYEKKMVEYKKWQVKKLQEELKGK